jgi:cytochrome c peroxidase
MPAMKKTTKVKRSILALLAVGSFSATAGEKILDLTNPPNYANQAVPAYITKDHTPPDNEITDLGATLGRVLFHDKRLSRNDTISCSSCHRQDRAFGDPATASLGVAGTTGRHSMRLVNARFSTEGKFFWDERAASVEAQVTQPIQDHVEMGFSGTLGDPSFPDLVAKLSLIEEYQVLFQGVFGDEEITEARVGKALAQFVRSIQSFDSKYDVGRSIRNDGQAFPNFTASENNGKQIFLNPPNQGGAGCAGCHRPPEFDIDPNSGNNGVVTRIGGGIDLSNTRSPSLRDLVSGSGVPHGGFMHDASLTSLRAVIDHYNSIPAVVNGLDNRLSRPGPGGPQPQRLNLTVQQKTDLEAFLRTLTGTSIYTDEKFSSPFNEDGSLAVVVLPGAAAEMILHEDDGTKTVTLRAKGVPHVGYVLQNSADLTHWASTAITANAKGLLEVTVPVVDTEQEMFYRFAYGVTVTMQE